MTDSTDDYHPEMIPITAYEDDEIWAEVSDRVARQAEQAIRPPSCPHGRYVDDGETCDDCNPPAVETRGPIDWATFWDVDDDAAQWACEPLLPIGRAVHLYAPRAEGKSSLAVYVAAAIATGRQVLDHPAGPGVRVAYIDLEMTPEDLREHLVEYGYGPESDLSNLVYYIDPAWSKLDTAEHGMNMLAWVDAVDPDVLVVDSISRCISGEENSNDVYDALYDHAIGPLKRRGITSLWLGNSGKDKEKGSRGGSRKEDVMDTVWQMSRGDDGSVKLRNTKKRSRWIPDEIGLQRTEDDDGIVAYRTCNPTASLPKGSIEVAALLDKLKVPLDAPVKVAKRALTEAGQGRRTDTVAGALKYRRWQAQSIQIAGERPGNASFRPPGNAPGTGDF